MVVHRLSTCRSLVAAVMVLVPASTAGQTSDTALPSLDSLLAVQVHVAARYAQLVSDAPASLTVVTADEIAAHGMRTLADVLSFVPGIQLGYDQNYTYVGVRGFSRPTDYNNRVLLLVNGHPVNENLFGTAFVGTDAPLDLAIVERVEVMRGPASAAYGSNAMLAVVNVVTHAQIAAGLSLEAASHRSVTGQVRWSRPAAGGYLLVAGTGGRSDGADYDAGSWTEAGTGPWTVSGRNGDRFAGGYAQFSRSGFRTWVRGSVRLKEVPTGAWTTDPHGDVHTDDRLLDLNASWERPIGAKAALVMRGGSQLYRYHGSYPDPVYDWDDASDGIRTSTDVQLLWDLSPAHRLVVGVAGAYNPVVSYRTFIDDVPNDSFESPYGTVAAYVQDEIHLAHWASLSAGARMEWQSGLRGHLTPRGGVVLRPLGGTTLKLLHGEAFRSPNAYESGIQGTYFKQAVLTAERIRTSEVVTEQRIGRSAMLRATAFVTHLHDLIDLGVDESDGMLYYSNRGRADARGIEAEATVTAGRWLLQAGGVLLDTREPDADSRLTNAPTAAANVALSGRPVPALLLGLRVRGESGRQTLRGHVTGSWIRTDLNGRVALSTRAGVALLARNLFDASYHVPGGPEHPQDRLPQEGRSIHLRLEYGW